MNQILGPIDSANSPNNLKKKNKKKFLLFQLIFSFLIVLIFLVILFSEIYGKNKIAKQSEDLLNSYSLTKLYYNSSPISYSENSIIGTIEIPKINISYVIFYSCTEELLKISPCRFYGPLPNNYGNLCIAGHNYDNSDFFSKLYELDLNDKINIYDLNNNCLTYVIYDIFEVSSNDTSIIKQDYLLKEITLITCNNVNKKRLVIKAKEGT